MNKRNPYRRIAILLAIAALLTLVFTLGRAMYFPKTADSGLTAAVPLTSGPVDKTVAPSEPSMLEIPKVGISAKVQQVGILPNGNMGVPSNFTDVGWYEPGTIPGQKGSAVIAGHQDRAGNIPAVFYRLEDLKIGDDVFVTTGDGKRLHFKVIEMKVYPYNSPDPLERIFNAKDGTYLNLITCAGSWIPSAKTNNKRLVVYTKLVQ
jgi:sortase A